MYDPDIESRLRSGGQMVAWGIVVLTITLLGTCVAGASSAGSTDPFASGFEAGESPFLLLGMLGGIALITLGQVKKSNARRDAEARLIHDNTQVESVLDEDSPHGPFRGQMKEVETLDPIVAAALEGEKEAAHSRGTTYLVIGGTILVLTVVGMVMGMSSSSADPLEKMEQTMVAFGLAVFPFGLGLFFAIRGLLLRSK